MNTTLSAPRTVRNYAAGNRAGELVREWRQRRRMSQLALAAKAGCSQRHLRFVESGRAGAGREMILRLGEALDLPLRARNELLLAAGFAPLYEQRTLDHMAMLAANQALERILQHHEPYPAMVLDAGWHIRKMNRACARIVGAAANRETNLLRLLCTELRPGIRSWPRTGQALLARLRREASAYPGCAAEALLDELKSAFPVFDAGDPPVEPVMPVEIMIGGDCLRLFTMLTTFGTPQDVTLEELRIEMSFPADEASDGLLRAWAANTER